MVTIHYTYRGVAVDGEKGEGQTLWLDMKTRDKLLKWTEKWGASFNEGPKSGTGEGCAFKTDQQKNVIYY